MGFLRESIPMHIIWRFTGLLYDRLSFADYSCIDSWGRHCLYCLFFSSMAGVYIMAYGIWHWGPKNRCPFFFSFWTKQTQMKVLNSYIITTKQRNKILCILPHDDIHCVDFLTSLHVFMALGDGYVKQTAMDDESCITAVRATREICSYTTASYFTASHSRRKQLESSQKMIEW